MNREPIFKYLTIWMQDAMCESLEESDMYRDHMSTLWCDEMTSKEHEAIIQYLKPFMDRFYDTEEQYTLMQSWEEIKRNNSKRIQLK